MGKRTRKTTRKRKSKKKTTDKIKTKKASIKVEKKKEQYDCKSGVCILSQKALKQRKLRVKKKPTIKDIKGLSIDPKLWGPFAWCFLDGLTVLFPDFKGKRAIVFIHTFGELLPCGMCEQAFKKYLKENPLTSFWSGKRLSLWLNKAHNEINVRNGGTEWDFKLHANTICRISVKSWINATFSMLFYLMEYEALKRNMLFEFLKLLSNLLQEHTINEYFRQFGVLINKKITVNRTFLSCKTSCLQQAILDVKTLLYNIKSE